MTYCGWSTCSLFEEARFSRHPIPGSAPRLATKEFKRVRAALSTATQDGAETG